MGKSEEFGFGQTEMRQDRWRVIWINAARGMLGGVCVFWSFTPGLSADGTHHAEGKI